jgi:hypothetical protein
MKQRLDGVARTFSTNAAFFHPAVRHVTGTEGQDIRAAWRAILFW